MSAVPPETSPDPEYLKLLQAVITRMAGNSFLLKGWAVTLVAGLSALAKTDADRDIAWVACASAILFALIDAMYLANERAFRDVYDQAADGAVKTWSVPRPAIGASAFLSALFSWSVLPIYLVAAASAAYVAAVL